MAMNGETMMMDAVKMGLTGPVSFVTFFIVVHRCWRRGSGWAPAAVTAEPLALGLPWAPETQPPAPRP